MPKKKLLKINILNKIIIKTCSFLIHLLCAFDTVLQIKKLDNRFDCQALGVLPPSVFSSLNPT